MALDSTRFSPITPSDHAGVIWVLSLLAGTYSAMTLLLRCHVKRRYFGRDDWIFVAASVFSFAAFFTTYAGLAHGLGRSTSETNPTLFMAQNASRSLFYGRILLILALCLSKCSVVLLIQRLFSEDMIRHRTRCNALIGATIVWGIGSALGLAINCSSKTLLNPRNTNCPSQAVRWGIIGTIDALLELAIVLLSLTLVWGLQLKFALKIRVVLAFSFRLPLAVTSIMNITYISGYAQSLDPGLAVVSSISAQQIHLFYSLFSATIPNIKNFLLSFDTGVMMNVAHKSTLYPHGSSNNSKYPDSHHLKRFSKQGSRLESVEEADHATQLTIGKLRPETGYHHITAAWHDEGDIRESLSKEESVDVGDNEDMIIRKDIRFTVRYGSR